MNKRIIFEGNQIADTITFQDPKAQFALPGANRNGQRVLWPISSELLSRHMLLLGGIGTGKSNTFYQLIQRVRSTLSYKDVMFIFDTKGDYYKQFYQLGDVVISNDERACGPKGKDYWNIFNEVMVDSRLEENVLEICKTLFAEKLVKTSQPFFPNAAKDLLYALILYLCREPAYGKQRNNESLRRILDAFDSSKMVNILKNGGHADLQAMQFYIQDPTSPQTQGVVSELQQAVREVFLGNFAKKGTLSMRELVRQKGGRIVFVEYDLGIGTMLTPIYRLLFDLAIKQALCRTEDEGNVYFMIDEFRLLPMLQHIDDGVNFGRSLGAKFIIGAQNVEQIEQAYGRELARGMLSGFSTTVSFRLNDGGSRAYMKELLGKNVVKLTFQSAVQNRGIVEEIREANVAEDWDITRLGIGEAIINYGEHMPFRIKFDRFVK